MQYELVSPANDVWETGAGIPYLWRFTTQIWVVLLIGWIKFPTRHDHSMETNHSWWRPSEADMEFTLPKTRIESQSRKYKLRKTLSWQSSTTDFIPRHFATSVIHIQVIQASSATRACGVEGYLGTWTRSVSNKSLIKPIWQDTLSLNPLIESQRDYS